MTTQQHRFAWTFAVSCTLVVGLMACSDSPEDGTEATQRAASTTATAPSSELGTSTTTGPSPVTDQQVDDTTTTETALEVTTTAAHIGKPPSPTTTHQAAVGPPSVMSAPIVVETTNSAVTIAFVEADSSGPAVDEYEVAAGSGQAVGCAMSPCTITGLTNGVSYKFRVRAHNSVGWSDWSSWSLPCSPFGVPGTPSAPVAAPGDHLVVVGWEPIFDNGSPVISVTVNVSNGQSVVIPVASGSSATITGLNNGQTYTLTIVAANAAGQSVASPPSAPVVPAGLPSVPIATFVALNASTGALQLQWSSDPNGAPILYYEIQWNGDVISVGAGSNSATLTFPGGLQPGDTYTCQVRAVNTVGAGGWSTRSVTVPL